MRLRPRYAAWTVAILAAMCAVRAQAAEPVPGSGHRVPQPEVVSAATLAERIRAAKGTPLVVNFWATWCPPCVNEMPELTRFYTAHRDRGVVFLSVSVDDPSTVERRVKPFVDKHTLPFAVLVLSASPEEVDGALPFPFDGAVPATFVLGASGTVQHQWNEEVTNAELSQAVAPLLDKPSGVSKGAPSPGSTTQ